MHPGDEATVGTQLPKNGKMYYLYEAVTPSRKSHVRHGRYGVYVVVTASTSRSPPPPPRENRLLRDSYGTYIYVKMWP